MQSEPVTLEQLLASRDARHAKQQALLADYEGCALVCLTVIVPGPVKRNADSLAVAHAAVEALAEAFGSRPVCTDDLPTGFAAYLPTSLPADEAKRIAVRVEDTHPLGRLFDVDVLLPDATPLSRHDIGEQPRKCLLCDREARFCMRNHSHTTDELLQHIHHLVASYD